MIDPDLKPPTIFHYTIGETCVGCGHTQLLEMLHGHAFNVKCAYLKVAGETAMRGGVLSEFVQSQSNVVIAKDCPKDLVAGNMQSLQDNTFSTAVD